MRLQIVVGIALCILCVAFICLLPIQVQAAEYDGFSYEVHDGKATITGCTAENIYTLEIPATIDGYPVVGIGESAFEKHPTLMDVKISEGVETIGNYAFLQCQNLTWLELPNSLISIGEKAFFNCKYLNDVWFGYNLKSIGDGAFSYCYSLNDILVLPYKLESIGDGAFYNCGTLEQVKLPNSLKELGSKAFAMCDRLEYVSMPSDLEKVGANAFYQSACYNQSYNWDGDVFSLGTYLLNAKNSISGSYEVYPRITHIADEAFLNCDNLTEIILPEDLRIIGVSAFEDCEGLQNVVFPSGVTTIEEQAFYNCKALSDIQIPDSITYIGQDAFKETAFCDNAENWENGVLYSGSCLVQCNSSVSGTLEVRPGTKMILSGAIKEQKGLTELILPDTVTTIGEKALYGCSGLKSIYLGKGVSQIGPGAFGLCPSLESIAVHSDNTTYRTQNNCLIRTQDQCLVIGCKTSQIPQDGSVTSIGAYAFEGCEGLTEITIPNAVLTVGEGAFRDCDALTSVNLGDGVQIVGKRAFETCDSLCQIDLGQSVHTIDDYGFGYNHQLTHVEFPASLRYLGEEAFSNGTGLVSVSFQEGLLTIGKNCFTFCENLTSLHLPDSLEKLEDGAFYSCEKISSLTLGENLTSIGSAAFSGCEALTAVVIPDKVQTIGNSAFCDCTSMRQLDLGQVEMIEYSAFWGCRSLTEIHIPASVTKLGKTVFSNCRSIEQLTVDPQNKYYHSSGNCIINTAGKYLAYGCKNSIIPADGSVTVLDGYAFEGCKGLKSIVVPETVTRICAFTFYNCSSLEYMQLPFVGGESAYDNYIGYIFGGGPSQNDLFVPASLKRIVITGGTSVGDSGFSKCSGLQEIVLPETITTIGYSAFENCSQLQRVIVPGDLQTIKDANIFSCSPNAMLYISAGQKNTKALVESNGLPYREGGLITFTDEEGKLIDKVWYLLHAAISTPVVPEKPADDFYSYEISWEPTPGVCTGNQTICLRYIAHWIGGEILGDFNGDKVLTDADAIYLLRYTLFPENYPISMGADFNGDNEITDADAIYLLRHILFPEIYPLSIA